MCVEEEEREEDYARPLVATFLCSKAAAGQETGARGVATSAPLGRYTYWLL